MKTYEKTHPNNQSLGQMPEIEVLEAWTSLLSSTFEACLIEAWQDRVQLKAWMEEGTTWGVP